MFKFDFAEDVKEPEPASSQETLPCESHTIDILRKDRPRISYTSYKLNGSDVPRRDIFDVRYQLMGMDELNDQEKILLGDEDVRKNVYEGGLKVWEGALDLVECLENYDDVYNVLEMGCGAAVPSCYLLYQSIKRGKGGRFIFADYNEAVLRLLTAPNAILAWLAATDRVAEAKGEINLTADLIDEFAIALADLNIEVRFISGGWGTQFSTLTRGPFALTLASETIYSLESLDAFVQVLSDAIGSYGTGLVAAKKVYFGVGGSVVEFEHRLDSKHIQHQVVTQKGDVGRVVLRVSRSNR